MREVSPIHWSIVLALLAVIFILLPWMAEKLDTKRAKRQSHEPRSGSQEANDEIHDDADVGSVRGFRSRTDRKCQARGRHLRSSPCGSRSRNAESSDSRKDQIREIGHVCGWNERTGHKSRHALLLKFERHYNRNRG